MDSVRWLQRAGLAVEQHAMGPAGDTGADAVLVVSGGGVTAGFAVELKQRAPYPNELAGLRRMREAVSQLGNPLLVAPHISEPLGEALTAAGWSWADAEGDFDLRAPGLVFRQRRVRTAPRPARKTLPRGAGSFAIIRALIGFGADEEEGKGAQSLAGQASVSQPRASQVLRDLLGQGLVERTADGSWRPNREPLLDRFLAEYPGPGGSEQFFYSLDPPAEVAVSAVTSAGQVAISADVGPDLLRPWRRPSIVILYIRQLIDASRLGLAEAQGRHDANVIIRMPADRSVFPLPELNVEFRGEEMKLADPVQMVWDLLDLGGADRAEAAGELRAWLLARR